MKNVFFAIFVLFSSNTHAGITKWVDENNQVHYSDQPPPGTTPKKLLSNSSTDIPALAENDPESKDTDKEETADELPSEPKTIAEREGELKKARKKKQEAAEKEAEEQANQKIKQTNCNNARKSLKELQSGVRMTDIDDNGERYYLNDAQRQQRISETQKDINRLCKKVSALGN